MYTAKFTSALLVPVSTSPNIGTCTGSSCTGTGLLSLPVASSSAGSGNGGGSRRPFSRGHFPCVCCCAMGKGVVEASVPRDSVTVALPQIVDEAVPDVMNFQPFTFLLLTPGKRERKASFAPSPIPCFNIVGGGAARPLACRVTSTTGSTSLVGAIVFCVGSSCSCWFLDLSRIGGP